MKLNIMKKDTFSNHFYSLTKKNDDIAFHIL